MKKLLFTLLLLSFNCYSSQYKEVSQVTDCNLSFTNTNARIEWQLFQIKKQQLEIEICKVQISVTNAGVKECLLKLREEDNAVDK